MSQVQLSLFEAPAEDVADHILRSMMSGRGSALGGTSMLVRDDGEDFAAC